MRVPLPPALFTGLWGPGNLPLQPVPCPAVSWGPGAGVGLLGGELRPQAVGWWGVL